MERAHFEPWNAKEVARLLALVEGERRYYQEMLAALPVALVVLSAERSIVSVNRAFRQTFGVRMESVRGKNIEQILPSERLVEAIRDAHVHGIPQPALFLDFGDRQFRIAIVPIRSWDEESEVETLLMVEDLAGFEGLRRVAPAAPSPEPKPTIAAPTADAGRRKQLEEQRLTAGRTEALRGLAGRLAHDINNPLMIVTGYSEELLQGLPKDDPRRGEVEQILAATERIAGLTAQLLAFARRKANPKQPVDVRRALVQMEDKIVHAAGEGVTVELDESAGAVWALADLEQFEEVILALVSGAREDAKERSRVTVGCRTEALTERVDGATLDPGLYAVVTIHDDGRGLDPEKRAAVFESFLAKDPEKSAGPALARAYAMVREWGGDIAFSSEPFRGSTFTVYLPYHAASREPAQAPAVTVLEPRAEPARGTILVVDDEVGIRALMGKILRRERYHVLEAGSTEEALDVAAMHRGRIDLLLTDVTLPGASGRSLAERLSEARPGLKVVYVSGFTDDEAVRAGAFPPGAKYLQKPFTLGALVGKVREALGG